MREPFAPLPPCAPDRSGNHAMFGPNPRKEMPPRKLDRAAFAERFRA